LLVDGGCGESAAGGYGGGALLLVVVEILTSTTARIDINRVRNDLFPHRE